MDFFSVVWKFSRKTHSFINNKNIVYEIFLETLSEKGKTATFTILVRNELLNTEVSADELHL